MQRLMFSQSFLILLLTVTLTAAPAMAHKVNIFAYVEDRTVYVESYFPDGRPVEEGRVVVLDSEEEMILEGRTDNEGLFHFPVTKTDDLTIVIEAGMGHKNSFPIKKSALKE